MSKNIIVGLWDAKKPEIETSYIYNGISREKAIICFINQYFNKNYNTWEYETQLNGIRKSNIIKDRLLYDYTDDLIIYAQYA